jgi:hypothetical protein
MMPEPMPAPHDDMVAAPHEEPVPPAPRPAAARPAAQKSVYDSLEQEMASLLGRPNSKN